MPIRDLFGRKSGGKPEMVSHAIGTIHTQMVRAFLERDEKKPSDGLSVLMRAALIGDTAAVVALLDRGVSANLTDGSGRTALMEAAYAGHWRTIEALILRGADANAKDNAGWTALMEAASKSRIEAVKVLLCHGADATARAKNGLTALKAAPKTSFELIKLIKESVR